MNSGDFMRATVIGAIEGASNPVINTWDFRLISLTEAGTLQEAGEEIVDAFLIRYYSPLLPQMSSYYTLNEVQLRIYGNSVEGYNGVNLDQNGGAAGAMCPPFVTYSVELQRSNFAMRNGRKAYPAVPTSVITANGQLTTEVQNAFDTVFDGWETTDFLIEADGNDIIFEEVIVRKPPTPNTVPTVYSRISGYTLEKFGTQNSRKA